VVLQNTVVGHHGRVGDLTIMAAGVTLSGYVTVGERCYIGVGTSLKEGVEVAAETLIGAGSVVVSDIKGCRVAYGVPAKAVQG
jgi:UDP-3-O-[3-hydroxymyristoyl] glucosamine N-acyltransferase